MVDNSTDDYIEGYQYETKEVNDLKQRIKELEKENSWLRGACVKPGAIEDYIRINRRLEEQVEVNRNLRSILQNLSDAVGGLPVGTGGEDLDNAWEDAKELLGES